MFQLLLTDFIKNRSIQAVILLGIFLDISLSRSIRHVLALFSLPYLTSVTLGYLLNPKKIKFRGRISEQYRPKVNKK